MVKRAKPETMKKIFFIFLTLFFCLFSTVASAQSSDSNSFTFTVYNPLPVITAITPSSGTVGDQGLSLTVKGDNFISDSVVNFNGSPRGTTFISKTQISASLTSFDFKNEGTYSIGVTNPSPGGGTSSSLPFVVSAIQIPPPPPPIPPPPPPETPPPPPAPPSNPITTVFSNFSQIVSQGYEGILGITREIGGNAYQIVTKAVEILSNGVSEVVANSVQLAGIAIEETKKVINTPQGAIATKTVSTVGATVTVIATSSSVATYLPSFYDITLSLTRLLGSILTALGIRKRNLPWGIVYDSVTKQPLDPAYVTLSSLGGKEVASAITDIDGRYGFLVAPGSYLISAKKTNYEFPSKKISGKIEDGFYGSLYFGEQIEIKERGETIAKNIPLDPIHFDWNEFAKKNKTFMKFYSRWDLLLGKIYDASFIVGFLVSLIAFFLAPHPYNTIIVIVYLVLLLLRTLGLKPRPAGYVFDKATGVPLSFAVIRIVGATSHVEISHKIADKYGRYYCLVPRGKYYVKIEKKNSDGSYSLIHTSSIIDAQKNGIIKKKFEI